MSTNKKATLFPRLVRRLWALTREDVRTSIFQRHSSEEDLDRTVSPIPPRRVVPTPSPVVASTAAPTVRNVLSATPSIFSSNIPSMIMTAMPVATAQPATSSQEETEPPTQAPITAAPATIESTIPTILQNDTSAPTVSNGNSNSSTSGVPTVVPAANSSTAAPTKTETLQEFLERTITESGEIEVTGSAQNDAVLTIGLNFPDLQPIDSTSRSQIRQLYSLYTIFYELNGPEWKARDAWDGDEGLCADWHGVECNDDLMVVALNLTDNDLVGTIPSEIRGLLDLGRKCFSMQNSLAHLSFRTAGFVQQPHYWHITRNDWGADEAAKTRLQEQLHQ